MRLIRFFIIGILFGIVLFKSEVISWYRIQEMFHFDAFHMYGIIGSAIGLGILIVQLFKRSYLSNLDGGMPPFKVHPKGVAKYLGGGTLFGLGWALTGACPGPIYILIGSGFSVYIMVLVSAVVGAFAYGVLSDRLP